MKLVNISQLDLEDAPTAKTCPECEGSGTLTLESGTRYTVKTCMWCKGSGRIPVSGVFPAIHTGR